MTIKEYIRKYGNSTFEELPFTEVDALLFSELSYVDLRKIFKYKKNEKISLQQLSEIYFKKYDEETLKKEVKASFLRRIVDLFKSMSHTKRYQDILVYNYQKEVEKDTQFGAVSLLLPDGTVFISFEGTDDSISGWKEDFQMVYQFPVLAQKKAARYLKENVSLFGPKVRIGGHSKGGNLAMSSYLLSNFIIHSKVLEIYNFDGPGFRKNEYDSKAFSKMLKKLKMYVPEECYVGVLLRHPEHYKVVKSRNHSLFQHEAISWLVDDISFQKGKISSTSKKLEKKIFNWVCSYDDVYREKIVLSLFSILEGAGVEGLSELRITKVKNIIALIQENRNMDKPSRDLLIEAFKSLIFQKVEDVVEPIVNK